MFSFLAISAIGCAPMGKYSRTYIPPDSPFYDIPTIRPAPQRHVAAVLAADEQKKREKGKRETMIARPNQKDYEEFKKRISQERAAQKAKAVAQKIPKAITVKKRTAFTKKTLKARLSKVEKRVNCAIAYGRENRNRIGLLEDRFNLSPSGNIQAKLVLFKPGSAELSVKGKKILDELAIKDRKGEIEDIIITGHASKTKGKIDNKNLSQQRAKVACYYLRDENVKAEIVVAGESTRYGENKNISITWLKK